MKAKTENVFSNAGLFGKQKKAGEGTERMNTGDGPYHPLFLCSDSE
jgi:hypothetical protein